MRKILFPRITRGVNGMRRLGAIAFAGLLPAALAGTKAAATSPSTIARDGGRSMCSGPCAQVWPPLTTNGKPTAGSGVTASKLTTVTRSDGSTQVVYAGHPLYYVVGDTSAGATNGQGINNFGGLWWLLSPAGMAIQK
jgi:hypothetical protein